MYKEFFDETLAKSKLTRTELVQKPGILMGDFADKGSYLINYANCLLNREIDIFDDAVFLLENNRIASACVISRGMIETYAFSKILSKRVAKALNEKKGLDSVETSLEIIDNFVNSSRFKQSEQKKIKDGVYDPNDYYFTDQAKNRFEKMLASSEHVMKALRDLYEDEIKFSEKKESSNEIIYDALSEWVHPSQTSIFHNYVPEAQYVPTSKGIVHIYDGAKFLCAGALDLINDSMNIYNWTLELADEISRRSKESS